MKFRDGTNVVESSKARPLWELPTRLGPLWYTPGGEPYPGWRRSLARVRDAFDAAAQRQAPVEALLVQDALRNVGEPYPGARELGKLCVAGRSVASLKSGPCGALNGKGLSREGLFLGNPATGSKAAGKWPVVMSDGTEFRLDDGRPAALRLGLKRDHILAAASPNDDAAVMAFRDFANEAGQVLLGLPGGVARSV